MGNPKSQQVRLKHTWVVVSLVVLSLIVTIIIATVASTKTINTSREGEYETDKWKYEYKTKLKGTKSETRIGHLRYDGKNVENITDARIFDYIETPWGIMQFFGEARSDGPQYRIGWLTKDTYDKPLKLEKGKKLENPATQDFASHLKNVKFKIVEGEAEKDIKPYISFKHEDRVDKVLFTPDSSRILSESFKDDLKISETLTGKLLRTLPFNGYSANSMALSSDGVFLAVGTNTGKVELWDTKSMKLQKTFPVTKWSIYAVALSPDGKMLGSCAADGTVQLWDIENNKKLETLGKKGAYRMSSMSFSPDSKVLATLTRDGRADIWDVAKVQLITTLPTKADSWGACSITFCPDANTVAIATPGLVLFWEPQNNNQVQRINIPDAINPWKTLDEQKPMNRSKLIFVGMVVLSPDCKKAATVIKDGSIVVWDVQTRTVQQKLVGSRILDLAGGGVRTIAFSHDKKLLASGNQNGTVEIYRWAKRTDGAPSKAVIQTPNAIPILRLEKAKYVICESIRFWIGVECLDDDVIIPEKYWNTCFLHITRPDGTIKKESVGWPMDGMLHKGWTGGYGFGKEEVEIGKYTLVFEFANKKTEPVELIVEELDVIKKIRATFNFPRSGNILKNEHIPIILTVQNNSEYAIQFPRRGVTDSLVSIRVKRKEPSRDAGFFYPIEKLKGSMKNTYNWGRAASVPPIVLQPGERFEQELSLEEAYEFWGPGQYEVTFSTALALVVSEKNGKFTAYCPIRLPVIATEYFNVKGTQEISKIRPIDSVINTPTNGTGNNNEVVITQADEDAIKRLLEEFKKHANSPELAGMSMTDPFFDCDTYRNLLGYGWKAVPYVIEQAAQIEAVDAYIGSTLIKDATVKTPEEVFEYNRKRKSEAADGLLAPFILEITLRELRSGKAKPKSRISHGYNMVFAWIEWWQQNKNRFHFLTGQLLVILPSNDEHSLIPQIRTDIKDGLLNIYAVNVTYQQIIERVGAEINIDVFIGEHEYLDVKTTLRMKSVTFEEFLYIAGRTVSMGGFKYSETKKGYLIGKTTGMPEEKKD